MAHGAPFRLTTLASLAFTLTCAHEPVGCLGSGDPACVPPSPCGALTYTCASTRVRAYRFAATSQRVPGLEAEASVGDVVLENDLVTAVIDDIGHPHHLAASGGTLLDLAPRGGADALNAVYTVTGILPRDAPKYRSLQVIESPGMVAVIARGTLDGNDRVQVTTRYELRACDPGVRVRTEVFNGSRDVSTWFLADAWWWGDRSMTPFIPTAGNGFVHPPLDLVNLDASWRVTPWMAAQSHVDPAVSYATVACGRASLEGVQDLTISAVGLPRTVVRPGDGQVFERMIFTAAGGGIAGAASYALDAHARMNGGATTVLAGRVLGTGGAPVGDDERMASVVAYEPDAAHPDDPLRGTIWSQAVPDATGHFTLRVPSQKAIRVQVQRFGRATTAGASLTPSGARVELGDLTLPTAGTLAVTVREGDSERPLSAELVMVPVEGVTASEAVSGSLLGVLGERCVPFLGPPHGASPACNRVLAFDGSARFSAPAGTYWLYATAGPGATLARARVTVREGEEAPVTLRLTRLAGLYPEGSLTGDMHVHGGRSFDSALPDVTRVQSFITTGLDVIVATDHNAVTSYDEALRALNAQDRVVLVSGTEATPLVPWLVPPGGTVPRVVGHFMFWPMAYDPTQARNGMPWENRVEPGAMFDRMRAVMPADGVIQLNHPTAHMKAGRDEGYFRMLGFHTTTPIPLRDDGTGMGMLWRRPNGATGARNLDWHVQEAMNGAGVVLNLGYRASWFAMLDRGLLRGATANSDSHSLTTEQVGYPRNIVLGRFDRARFDRSAYDRAVREGHVVGSNGPVIEARSTDAAGNTVIPGVTPFAVSPGAMLDVEVRAAPWVPVTEVRFVVNGRVARTVPAAEITQPADPFGHDGTVRWRGRVALAELLGGRDGWVVVEAGLPLPAMADLEDDDGLPDHIDGDGDGAIDDTELLRPRESDARFHVDVVSPGALPFAFTNPFVVDLDGNGWSPPR